MGGPKGWGSLAQRIFMVVKYGVMMERTEVRQTRCTSIARPGSAPLHSLMLWDPDWTLTYVVVDLDLHLMSWF